jgi:hypothetical protein
MKQTVLMIKSFGLSIGSFKCNALETAFEAERREFESLRARQFP